MEKERKRKNFVKLSGLIPGIVIAVGTFYGCMGSLSNSELPELPGAIKWENIRTSIDMAHNYKK